MTALRKYRKIFTCTLRDQLHYIPAFLLQNFFLVIILFIFFSLWRVVYADKVLVAGLSLNQVLWYLTFTETIELSKSRSFIQIQDEIKDGSIAYALGRPYSYVAFTIVKAMGEAAVRVGPIFLEGSLVAWLLIGGLPDFWLHLPLVLLVVPGGILLTTLWGVNIGLLAFWTEEVAPFYWILQKLIFILGGMFFPLDFFPRWIQGTARMLPFAFSAYWPGITMVNYTFKNLKITLTGQLVYCLVLILCAGGTYRAAVRKMHVQGG